MKRSPAKRQNPLLSEWAGKLELPSFEAIKPDHFRTAFDRALADHRAEIDAIAANPAPPDFDNTVGRSSEAAVPSSGWRTYSLCWPAPTRRTKSKPSSGISRRCWRVTTTRFTSIVRSIRGLRNFTQDARRFRSMLNRPACWSAITPGSFALAPRWSSRRRIDSRRSTSVWRALALSLARTCWRTRSHSRWSSKRATLPAYRTLHGRLRVLPPMSAATRANTLLRWRDRPSKPSSSFLRDVICGKRHSRPGSRVGKTAARPIIARLIAEMVCAARGTRKAARLCELRRLPSRRPDGQDAASGSQIA